MSVISLVSPNTDYGPWFESANESNIFFQYNSFIGEYPQVPVRMGKIWEKIYVNFYSREIALRRLSVNTSTK